MKAVLACCLAASVVLVLGCGGGGGGGDGAGAGTASGASPLSGSIVVVGSSRVEAPRQDSFALAQLVNPGETVFGRAGLSDSSLSCGTGTDRITVQDLYRVELVEQAVIILTLAQNDLGANDLDLYLLDANCNRLASSDDFGSAFEVITTSPSTLPIGTYFLGVAAVRGASGYLLSFSTGSAPVAGLGEMLPVGAAVFAGEVIVKWRARLPGKVDPSKSLPTAGRALANGAHLIKVAPDSQTNYALQYGLKKRSGSAPELLVEGQTRSNASLGATLTTLRNLRDDPDVEFAELNYLVRPAAIPTDPGYSLQRWHYEAINLPVAWDRATGVPVVGESDVIVAVLDTGVVSRHPDLQGRLVPGFDFVSDPNRAGDGSGADTEPEDTGSGASAFHGTNVAGIIAAAANNGVGLVGVSWGAKIMPLRVLAPIGSVAMVAEAVYYAAGLPNASGLVPSRRADIINLSLGTFGRSQQLEDAINAAMAQGVIVIAAAGNEGAAVSTYPAAYPGVIAVGATGPNRVRAPYSNFGTSIDVVAPGGNQRLDRASGVDSVDLDGDGRPEGSTNQVWSTDGNASNYRGVEGTSMASAHVSGVVALMKAVKREIGPDDINLLLAGSHQNSPASRITMDPSSRLPWVGPKSNDLGYGLIDALAAVSIAGSLGPISRGQGARLAGSAKTLLFAPSDHVRSLTLSNVGEAGSTLQVSNISADQPWIKINGFSASQTTPVRIAVSVDRTGLAAGSHSGSIVVTSDASQAPQMLSIPVTLIETGSDSLGGEVGPLFVLLVDAVSGVIVDQVQTNSTSRYAFAFAAGNIRPGRYVVIAGTDRDNDGLICDLEDACGWSEEPITLEPGGATPPVRLSVGHFRTVQATATGFAPGRFPRR